MTWSLSKDDDGLEGLGSSPEAAGPASAAVLRTPPSFSFSAPNAPDGPGGSVVVDPVSQIPPEITKPSRPAVPSSPRRPAEATLVLRNRQLDRLRAEVRKRQLAFQRRRFGALLIWGLAGGAAVFLGALLAKNWSEAEPEGAAEASPLLEEVAPASPDSPAQAERAAAIPAQIAEKPVPPTPAPVKAAVGRGAEPTRASSAPQPTAPQKSSSSTAARPSTSEGQVLSLDDLPTE